jgi:hypothetical protein
MRKIVGFLVLTVVVMKSLVLWDIIPCSLSKDILACYLLHAGFLLRLFFDPEDGGKMFLQNVYQLSTHYMMFYPRRLGSSCPRSILDIFSLDISLHDEAVLINCSGIVMMLLPKYAKTE